MPKSTFPIPDLNTEWEKEATREGSRHWWRRTREMSGRQLEKAEGALSSRLEQLTPLPSEKLRGRFLLQKESQRRCTRRHAPRGSLGLQLVTFQTWAHPPKGGGGRSQVLNPSTRNWEKALRRRRLRNENTPPSAPKTEQGPQKSPNIWGMRPSWSADRCQGRWAGPDQKSGSREGEDSGAKLSGFKLHSANY